MSDVGVKQALKIRVITSACETRPRPITDIGLLAVLIPAWANRTAILGIRDASLAFLVNAALDVTANIGPISEPLADDLGGETRSRRVTFVLAVERQSDIAHEAIHLFLHLHVGFHANVEV